MKALTLTQPWAQLVVEGHKEYETRSWLTHYRGWLAIHAGKDFPRRCQSLLWDDGPIVEALNRPPNELPRGAIVGVVTLLGCVKTDTACVSETERAFGNWGTGRYAWVFEDPFWLASPIPAKGSLGLWGVPAALEDEIQRRYIAQLDQQLAACGGL